MTDLFQETTPTKRGTRLSPEWIPSAEDIAFAEKLGMTAGQIQTTAEIFRDYWIALPGQKGVKLDWPATWRNWCRRDHQMKARGVQAFHAARPRKDTDEALRQRAQVAKKPWGRYRYSREQLQACVDAKYLTEEQRDAAL